jgi:hypothetical protein
MSRFLVCRAWRRHVDRNSRSRERNDELDERDERVASRRGGLVRNKT